ncbi:centrosome-associated protein 350-like isoform X1 [Amphiura filiformis]|uniref:centrosome-associated protein 350-like isoform X1 n=1 Tax=Amphiura filiformis TaxID=82378 RepID=UPI003B20BE4C
MKSDVKVPPVSNIGRNVPQTQTYYSPGALYLKMAAELNLLESLEVSVRQLTDMERTRAVSLAQQESMSLARILQIGTAAAVFKARQEVEDANKQLQEVKQCAAVMANKAERVLVEVHKEIGGI